MPTEEAHNKALIHACADRINAQDLDGALTFFGPNYAEHSSLTGALAGVAAVRAFYGALLAGFPDAQTTMLDIIAERDKVVVRASMEGTHSGPFMGIPPTGRSVTWSFIDIYRIVDGKIVEHWVETDQMSLMQQLGLVPPPRSIG